MPHKNLTTSWPKRNFPALTQFPSASILRADVLAGITVGLVLVPQAMAYAKLAEMPLITGLYAASFACMVGGLLGRCGQLQTGPVAMTSLLAAAAVGSVATTPEEFMPLMLVLAVLVGILRILIGLFRGANLVALINRPVMVGFTTAAGITIASTQIPKMFGLVKDHENPVFASLRVVVRGAEFHLPTLLMGAGTLLAMILLKKFWPKRPGISCPCCCRLVQLVAWFRGHGRWGYWRGAPGLATVGISYRRLGENLAVIAWCFDGGGDWLAGSHDGHRSCRTDARY